ncbi:MAG: HAMP domain-containing protein [Candidatus Kapabacteria bacterium]|nr:HAMP domain-containing protein [Candidatus Kapabacteria bacterium]
MNFYRNLRIRTKLGIGFFMIMLMFNLTVAAYINVIEQFAQNSITQRTLLQKLQQQFANSPEGAAAKQVLSDFEKLTVKTPVSEVFVTDAEFAFKVVGQINWLILVTIAIAITLQILISRSITAPIAELQQAADDIANGNFSREIAVPTGTRSKEEIGNLARAFATMTENIRTLIADVTEQSSRVQIAEQEARMVSEEIERQRHYLASSVQLLLTEMERLTEGDLTVHINVTSADDDIGKLYVGFNQAVVTMREMIMNVAEAVNTASMASDSILTGTEQMSAGIQEQSQQTASVATAMEEMTATIAENTRQASVAASEASRTSDEAERSRSVMQETTNGMNRIADTVIASAATIQELGRSSEQIGEIVSVIEEIADQTNLLALNAAIEAARAGDQGRGFAVVADEVRKLAERTQQATKQITATIKQIQNETANAVHVMNEGTREAERGKESVARTAEALQRIISRTAAVSEIISQLAAASEEQASTGDEIARNIDAINTVAGESAQVTRKIGTISIELHHRMNTLREAIGRFRVAQTIGNASTTLASTLVSSSVPRVAYSTQQNIAQEEQNGQPLLPNRILHSTSPNRALAR